MIQQFELYGEQLPLELFVILGTFIEELITPIPSFLVLVPAGVAAEIQGIGWWYLGVLAILSATGRLAGAIVVYWLADKFEDVLFAKGRRFFGYSHDDVENLGARLSGTKRDWLVLFLLNVIPAIPPVIPLACGFLKVRFTMFAVTLFLGNIFASIPLLFAGYAGLQAAAAISQLELASQILLVLLIAAMAGLLLWNYLKSKKHQTKN